MIFETKINLRNKTKEELILFVNEGLETIKKYEAELEKKDKEITKLKKHSSVYKKEFSRLNKLLQKKDKIIELMAEQLRTPVNSKEWVIDYYEREVKRDK